MPLQATKSKPLSDEDMGFDGGDAPSGAGLSDEEMGFSKNPSEARAKAAKPGLMDFVRSAVDTTIPGAAALRGLGGSPEALARHGIDNATFKAGQYIPAWKQQIEEDARDYPKSSLAGDVVGSMALGGGLAKGAATLLPKIAVPAVAAGVQGLLEKPNGDMGAAEDIKARLGQAKTGAEFGIGSQIIGGVSGKLGDWLMQKAVGRTKYTPGVGELLADQGVVGTRGMMKNQVNKAATRVGSELESAATNTPGMGSSQPVADRVNSLVKNIDGPNPSALDANKINIVKGAANDIDQRGMEPWADMLKRRVAAGQRVPEGSWPNQDPAQALTKLISKAEQGGYSDALKEGVPQFKTLDPQFSALAKARAALNKDPALAKALIVGGGGMGLGAGAGFFMNGKEGAAEGALAGLAGSAASTPLAKSVAAQALIKGSQNAPAINATLLDAYLRRKKEAQK